ncbi:arylsulfatase [Microbulbifer bruguierae]|uniref:Arylsulfatase n=1 Tax=Microbulbifer bruguierae TaxID=3029061 RepID=A0ABY8NCQ7_9GAMM|nr:arylsulfatase [Microbulbifer bruguierae]WGL16194.1 arylsulfatase [Microbulbifer bruguierae]
MNRRIFKPVARVLTATVLLTGALFTGIVDAQDKKPNILVIWGDDIGHDNVSAYHRGMLDYNTPNIDRIAKEGALFTDHYAQQSCTAGRASFALGQNPFRTGLLTIGMPGVDHGVRIEDPTLGELLKNYGYQTGQFGKNHLGDLNKYLPTVRGFDRFYGNLYHLNAEEEPENYDYPKEFNGKSFREQFGPRGMLDCVATDKVDTTVEPRWGKVGKQKCIDTGPLTVERMKTVEEEVTAKALEWMEAAVKANKASGGEKPFFMWFNSTRGHVWVHLSKEQYHKTGKGVFPDAIDELDWETGQLLDKLDELGVADNTIVLWSTDNGAEIFTGPDMGGMHAFRGEKGLTTEGGFRVPQLIRWPGHIKPGSIFNGITSHIDWMPTLLAAANGGKDSGIQEALKKGGFKADGKTFKAHLDGYNLLPYLTGKAEDSPRDRIYYFDADGGLNAVRWHQWKITFTDMSGNLSTAYHNHTSWPYITNLRLDPYERWQDQADMYIHWFGKRMYLMGPAQTLVKEELESLKEFPPARGSSLSLGDLLDKIQYAPPGQ